MKLSQRTKFVQKYWEGIRIHFVKDALGNYTGKESAIYTLVGAELNYLTGKSFNKKGILQRTWNTLFATAVQTDTPELEKIRNEFHAVGIQIIENLPTDGNDWEVLSLLDDLIEYGSGIVPGGLLFELECQIIGCNWDLRNDEPKQTDRLSKLFEQGIKENTTHLVKSAQELK